MSAYIVNITAKVESAESNGYKTWVMDQFIPFLNDLALGQHVVFTRVLDKDDLDGDTFSIQIGVGGQQGVAFFEKEGMPEYLKMTTTLFAGKVYYFKTLLEIQ
ncbi:DUF4286 family protein [Williamwhitmania taraxaci]|uniref:DUF4286 domain-containing protein n=1 Tax=Williamwhitmania taraxaci TaxID=1640674 RepID=A0A1G6IA53_9BACT|nr:DUF4286 family protein [Williamwhitmania taraxaci]SDC03263.1 protein of unknown function [Williamwhitmania taraxaci]